MRFEREAEELINLIEEMLKNTTHPTRKRYSVTYRQLRNKIAEKIKKKKNA